MNFIRRIRYNIRDKTLRYLLVYYLYRIHWNESKLQKVIDKRHLFTSEHWFYLIYNYYIPEIMANEFIIKKEELGKRIGIDIIDNMRHQEHTENFYRQPFILDLLCMEQKEYYEKMNYKNTQTWSYTLWHELFDEYTPSEKFIMDHAELFIMNESDVIHLQRRSCMPMEFYEKYIDEPR